MSTTSFEVRVCQSCGLRYPLIDRHPFGIRCPHCLGETRVALKKVKSEEGETGREKEKVRSDSREGRAVLLDNIRSAWNVGSILRSADGFGFSHAYLCGITPTPEVDAVRKTALGAEDYVTWSHSKDAVKLVKGLKKEGWTVGALEEDQRAKPISKFPNSQLTDSQTSNPFVLILGSEVTGVDPELLDLANHIFYIPMYGQKRSFNVANAFSIAAYWIAESNTSHSDF